VIISCDWGTSSCRLRVVDPGGRVLASTEGIQGVAARFDEWRRSGLPAEARAGFYQAVLQAAIGELGIDVRGMPVVLSGMASSSIGMMELPYHPLPFLVSGEDLQPAVFPATPAFPHVLYLVPGVRSDHDVMRGEETQLIGCGATSGLFIFPGTHSKHIVVQEGRAVGFTTFMTGEFFGLLSRQSILAASVAEGDPSDLRRPSDLGAPSPSDLRRPPDLGARPIAAFLAGVDAARRSGLLHSAFTVRTNQLFGQFSKTDNYQFLSGLVIGEELKGLAPQPVVLVAVPPLRHAYAAALQRIGFTEVEHIDADGAVVAGHRRIFEGYKNP
jgi:2-dehydro-3-deoxygalactonokinase